MPQLAASTTEPFLRPCIAIVLMLGGHQSVQRAHELSPGCKRVLNFRSCITCFSVVARSVMEAPATLKTAKQLSSEDDGNSACNRL